MTFNTALSGLRAASTDLEVTGNNIANASTTGFKRSRAEFGDVYANSLVGGGGSAAGSGVLVDSIAQQFDQGNVSFTDNSLDLAINGTGFFVLEEASGATSYTRAGLFGLDDEGFVTNNSGSKLKAFLPTGATGEVGGTPESLQVQAGDLSPSSTTRVDLQFNLDAREDPPIASPFDPRDADTYNSSTALTVFDSLGVAHVLSTFYVKTDDENLWNMYAYVPDESGTLQNVLNSGAVTAADVTAANTAAADNTTALADVSAALGAAGGSAGAGVFSAAAAAATTTALNTALASLNTALASATTTTGISNIQAAIDSINTAIAFGTATTLAEAQTIANESSTALTLATLAEATTTSVASNTALALTDSPYYELNFGTDGLLLGTDPLDLSIDGWDPADANASSVTGGTAGASDFLIDIGVSSQFGSEFSVATINQDGFATGKLSGLEISSTGEVFARYTNGEALILGRVAMASFANEQGLSPLGSTTWGESFESGVPVVGEPLTGRLGAIQSGALEESNVDLSEELVRLIIAQRNFQANAKTIETADTVQQAIINIR